VVDKEILDNRVSRFGVPWKLHSDQAPEDLCHYYYPKVFERIVGIYHCQQCRNAPDVMTKIMTYIWHVHSWYMYHLTGKYQRYKAITQSLQLEQLLMTNAELLQISTNI
jgi:hypothetical protein